MVKRRLNVSSPQKGLLVNEGVRHQTALHYFNSKMTFALSIIALIIPLAFALGGLAAAEFSKNPLIGFYYLVTILFLLLICRIMWGIFAAAENAEKQVLEKLYGRGWNPLKELTANSRSLLISDRYTPRRLIDRFLPRCD